MFSLVMFVAAEASFCPNPHGFLLYYAGMEIHAEADASCADVIDEIKARVASQGTNWVDPHNGGHYTILSQGQNELQLERKTGGAGKYTDKIHIQLQSGSSGKCEIHGCSRSQVNSYLDFSTNYCNIVALYCGNLDGKNCAPVKHDFTSAQRSAKSHAGATSHVSDCKLGDPGQAGVVVVKGRNLRSRLFNA